MFSSLQKRRILNTVRKIIIPALILLCLVSCSSIKTHFINTVTPRPIADGYKGGVIDDVRLIKCFHWFRDCNVVYEKTYFKRSLEPWLRVNKNLNDDRLFAAELGLLYRTFLYVHLGKAASEKKCISDLVISRDKSTVPVQVLQDINDRVRSKDSSMFHKHDHQKGFWAKLLGAKADGLTVKGEDWHYKGLGVWCKFSSSPTDDEGQLVTNIQVFIGDGFTDPRPMWKSAITGMAREKGFPLSVSVQKFEKNALHTDSSGAGDLFMKNGEYKILQLSDLHVGVSSQECGITCSEDLKTTRFISYVLAEEHPDLVIFTGDLIDGLNTLDFQAALLKATEPIILAGIPWLISWGTSDFSRFASKGQILDFVEQLPFCLNRPNKRLLEYVPPHTTNNALSLSNENGLVGILYILDSTSSENSADFLASAYKQTTDCLFGDLLYSLAFQHSPIPEYRPSGAFPIIGSYNEKEPLDIAQLGVGDTLKKLGVQALSCGNEHANDCCLFDEGIWLCYSGQTGVAGHSPSDSDLSTVRLFRVNDRIKEITTWKRNTNSPDEVYDYQFLFNDKQ
ncbi:LANO_0H21418g1_1 [Lachancea nothofagi CBS 11611]|uniref:LANO_0H21418g1_1 n=1 Tax=Lachancea nothofagi CBS 11611 TaxID=1266666 RepID=A0A1G4KNK6_9SACH|nr:LANO_0H21418g1_1 [Lachancea nothofagi CBS 11611]